MTGTDASGSQRSQQSASVAALSDKGPRRVNEDRSLAALSDEDGSWVIAVADGLGGHPRGDEAAQATVEGLPRRIASQEEMRAAFAAADERVLALAAGGLRGRRLHLYMLPMSTLSVAAWTPEGGLLIGWMGDTMPFVLEAGPDGFGGRCCGRPHRNPDGTIDECLGMPVGAGAPPHDLPSVEMAPDFGASALPGAVLIASDGAWEPFARRRGTDEWPWEDPGADGIAAACAPRAENALQVAGSVLARARGLGLNDNATVAVALWRRRLPAASRQ